jgi:hypothetical protein
MNELKTPTLTSCNIEKRATAPVTIFSSVSTKNGEENSHIWPLSRLFAYQTEDKELKGFTDTLRKLKAKDKALYREQRKAFLQVFVLGNWPVRGTLEIPVSLLVFDIDGGNEKSYLQHLASAHLCPFIYRLEQSLGGGCRVYVWADFAQEERKAAYLAIAGKLAAVFSLPLKADDQSGEHIDTTTSDISRMWFPAFTPPDLVYHNEESSVFTHASQEKKEDNRKEKNDQLNGYKYEFTEEEKVNDCIRQLEAAQMDITGSVTEDWFKILLAFANWKREAGREYAQRVSALGPSYSPQEFEYQYGLALTKDRGQVTIGSFLELCKDCGIRYDAKAIIANQQQGVLKKETTLKEIKIVPPVEITQREYDPPSHKVNGFAIEEDKYWFMNRNTPYSVSNFIINPLFLLKDSINPKRVLELVNTHGTTSVVCCPVKSLSSNNEFAAIVEGKGNFVSSWSRENFSKVKEFIYQFEHVAEEISVLGHQPDTNYYAFSNGVFDGKCFYQVNEYGICTVNGQHYYLPAFSKVNEDAEREFHNERKFVYAQGEADFSKWSKHLMQVFESNAISGVCFVVASAFRDIVFSHANSFPMLFLFGPKGTGKTTFRNSLHRLFGNYGTNDAIGLGSASSPKGFARKLAQVRNSIQPFEEYKNRIDGRLIEMLKNIYDGIGYERAQTSNDNRTHATLVNSSVILGGQEMPAKENALFSRVLMLTFDKTSFSKSQKEGFKELEKMISGGMANVLLEILQYRSLIARSFQSEYSKIYGHLRKDPETQDMEERTLSNMATILTPFYILKDKLDFPFTYKEAYQSIRECIKVQHQAMQKSNEISQFWEVMEFLKDKSLIQDRKDYRKGGQGEDEILSINLNSVFPLYYDYGKRQNINVLDKSTLQSYLSMQPYFKRQKNGRKDYPVRLEEASSNVTRCLQFRVKLMEKHEIDFVGVKVPEIGNK